MKKRAFLIPVVALISAISNNVSATVPDVNIETSNIAQIQQIHNDTGFILQNTNQVQHFAGHYSHSSHSSHSSHYSGYYN